MFKTFLLSGLLLIGAALTLSGLFALWLNFSDKRAVDLENWEITQLKDPARGTYDPLLVADLPEGVQRYFNFMIAPGAPLRTIARIEMRGMFGLGDANEHNYYPFTATQHNAPPMGFTWSMQTHDTPMAINGHDAFWNQEARTRFWLFGVVPVARLGGGEDYLRSGFGRVVSEMPAWSPVSMLPQFGVKWTQISRSQIRATVTAHGISQSVDIKIAENGAPTEFVIQRWSDANPSAVFQLQPFGAIAKSYATIDGITYVREVEAGNHFGTPDYFAFFKAEVTKFEFLTDGSG